MSDQAFRHYVRRIRTGLFLQVAGFTIGLIALAIILGMLIARSFGGQTLLSWLPLAIALPLNLFISTRLAQRSIQRIINIRQHLEDDDE